MRRAAPTIALLVLAAVISPAFCGQPLPEPWPPEPQWNPMPPEDARPPGLTGLYILGDEMSIEEGQPFYIYVLWVVVPSNEAYDLEGNPVPVEDRSQCKITLSLDGVILEPDSSFTATCRWCRYWREPVVIIPIAVWHEYHFVFPNGLDAGEYLIHVRYDLNDGSTTKIDRVLQVFQVSEPP